MIMLVAPSENYLEKILLALETYDDISKVKVILPTVAACLKLQHMIILKSQRGACFLPQIVPIINVGIGSEGIYNIPKESVEPVSLLEQKILIAKLILENKSDTTISQSLTLANHIIRLFDELAAYDIELTDLHLDIPINDAGHWQYMLEFLLKIRSKWHDIQVDLQKTDMAGYRGNMLQMEVDSIRSRNNIIIAGIIPRGKLVTELLQAAYDSSNSMLILPPMEASKLTEEVPVTHKMWPRHLCAKFIPSSNVTESTRNTISQIKLDILNLSSELPQPILIGEDSETMKNSLCTVNFRNVHVTPSLLFEAKDIAAKAKEWVFQGVQKVAIVTQNTDLINMVASILDMEKIDHINIGGYMLSRSKQYEFFMMLIKTFDSEYILNLENTIALFKSPYLFTQDIINFEYEIRKQQISSDEEFEKWIKNSPLILPALQALVEARNILAQDGNTTTTLKTHIALAEKLAPLLWNGEVGKVFSELLYDLLQIENLFECTIKDYIEFLEQTILGARYFKHLSNQPILFMNLEEASLGGYEYIICADMNEGSMPRSVPYDPWMNTQMRLSIGLPDVAENIGIDWYYFSNLLHRKNVFLTRSLKVGGRDTVPSRFWRDVANSKENVAIDSAQILQETEKHPIEEMMLKPYCEDLFPTKISATNLELLIRNPYGFYAKYILKLRKLTNIFDQNNLAKFGNFVHKTIEIYTNEYISNIPDKYAFIIEIGHKVASEYSKAKTNLWWPKFSAVMKAFITFDEERRADGRKIFSEIYGEMPLTIGDKIVTITAIADRVEQDSRGNIYILDYKTGTLPTKQDVIRGISVQMVTEAMIVDIGGFKEVSGKAYELTYVKITSREPYIEIVTYKVDELDLAGHKEGLYRVLEASIKGAFPINENAKFAPKYNDYNHLARVV